MMCTVNLSCEMAQGPLHMGSEVPCLLPIITSSTSGLPCSCNLIEFRNYSSGDKQLVNAMMNATRTRASEEGALSEKEQQRLGHTVSLSAEGSGRQTKRPQQTTSMMMGNEDGKAGLQQSLQK